MFEAYTYEALLQDVLDNAPAGIDVRQGSIYYDAVSGILLQIARMYADIDRIFKLVFLTTAEGDFLDARAGEYGVNRQSATPARYILSYEGTRPQENTRFFHGDSGFYFTVVEQSGALYLEAEQPGTVCNEVLPGDLAIPVNTIPGLVASVFGAIQEYGTDAETDESLRGRIIEKIAGPAENGNRQHYKTWCESVDGVGLARIFPLWNGENTVKAVLIDSTGKPCGASVVTQVQTLIDPADKGMTVTIDGKTYPVGDGLGNGTANIGAHFTAVSANELALTVSFSAELAPGADREATAQRAKEEIEEYLKQLVLEAEDEAEIVVRASAIGAILSGAPGIVDYSDLRLNGGAGNIIPGAEEVPVLRTVVMK